MHRAPYFKKNLSSEGRINKDEAKKAIYIDFEGFVKEAPSLVGVLIENNFVQVVLDETLKIAADFKQLATINGKDYMQSIIALALKENRKIIAFSNLEKEQCFYWYGFDISNIYINANTIAKKWKKNFLPEIKEKCSGLKDYEKLTGFKRGRDTGDQKNTSCIRAIRRDLEKWGTLKNKGPKRHWTNLLKHNKNDIYGMQFVIFRSLQLN